LPGLVVAILSDFEVHLVESRRLRCAFLRATVDALGLARRVHIHESRLETLPTRPAAVISARAFAPLPRLVALSTRFSTEKTRWILPKGRNAAKELALLPAAWQRLFHVEQSLTDADSEILVGAGRVGEKGRKRA
jgi:16S rRNA (guanine527-N7)-methyltransferase